MTEQKTFEYLFLCEGLGAKDVSYDFAENKYKLIKRISPNF